MEDRSIPFSGSLSSYRFLNSPFGDTTHTKVFVGGLAWETQSETMRRYFEQFGEILEAAVITDKNTGRSKGYGFVTFRDPDSARRACLNPNPTIDGRRANCNLASFGRSRPSSVLPFARSRPSSSMEGGGHQSARGRFIANFPASRQPLPYAAAYQHGYIYPPPYGYVMYGSEYMYPQQQYVHAFRYPGSMIYPYGELRQSISTPQIYAIRGQQMAFPSFGRPYYAQGKHSKNPPFFVFHHGGSSAAAGDVAVVPVGSQANTSGAPPPPSDGSFMQ